MLSDLGYRRTRRCAVAHEETESCGCADLQFRWTCLDRKAGICHSSGYLSGYETATGFKITDREDYVDFCGQTVRCKRTNECLCLLQKFEQTSKTGWVGHVSFHQSFHVFVSSSQLHLMCDNEMCFFHQYGPLPLFFAEDKLSFYKVMSDTQGYKHIHHVKDVSKINFCVNSFMSSKLGDLIKVFS